MHPSVSNLSGRARTVLLGTTMLASAAVMAAAPALAQDSMETVVVTGIRASLQSAQAIKQNSDQVVDSITAVDIGALPDNSVAEALQRVPGVQITRTDQPTDPLRWASNGNGVFIRGLSWVKSLTNGEEIFGAENGRTISFADISADLMAGVDVYKNPSAKMIEGGVGGTVNLRTRMPFDFDGRKIAVSGSLDYGTLADKFGESANAMYSDRFNTKVGEVGVLVSASFQNLVNSNNIGTTDPWTDQWKGGAWPNNTFSTPGHFYPRGFTTAFGMLGYRHMNWKQPRLSLDTTLQWRPNEALEVTVVGLFTKTEPQSDEHNVAWVIPVVNPDPTAGGDAANSISTLPSPDQTNALASVASYKYDGKGYLNYGTIYNAQSNSTYANYFDTRWDVRHHINKNVELNIKYNPNSHLSVVLDATYIDSRAYMSSMTFYNMVKNTAFVQSSNYSGHASFFPNAPSINVGFDFRDGSPAYTYDAAGVAALKDKSNYLWAAGMDHYENNYAHAYTTRLDATYTFDGTGLVGWVKSVDTGFRASLKSSATRNSGWNWGRTGFQTWSTSNCGRRDDYGGNVLDPITQCADVVGDFSTRMPNASALYNFPTFFGNSMPAVWEPKISWMQDPYQVWKDVQPTYAELAKITWPYNADGTPHAGNFTNAAVDVWTPAIVRDGNCTGVAYLCSNVYTRGQVNNQREDTIAGYAVVNFAHEATMFGKLIPIDGNVGVRIVNTMYDSGPGQLTLPNVTGCGDASAVPPIPGAPAGSDRAKACAFVGTQNDSSTSYPGVTTNYVNALPSLNVRAGLTDQVLLRLGYSQGLVRPDLEKMRNYTTLGFAWGGLNHENDFAVSNALTGTGSNPYLKPTYSQNYDVSLEWYFSPSNYVSAAFFYKTVGNYVMSGYANMPFTRNGQTFNFLVGSYVNGTKGTVKGIELAYQQFYDFLPGALSGLGFQANYTKIWNNGGANPVRDVTQADSVTFASDPSLPMEGMSADSYNVVAMYEKYDISARLAYNWRSKNLVNSYPANLFQPVFQKNYGQLDGSVLYTMFDHYKVGFQVSNLLKQTAILTVGRTLATQHDYQWVEGERKMSLVLRATW